MKFGYMHVCVCVNCDDTDKCMLCIRYKQTLHVSGVLHYTECVCHVLA